MESFGRTNQADTASSTVNDPRLDEVSNVIDNEGYALKYTVYEYVVVISSSNSLN